MSVGSSAVVPKRRCAATIAAMPSGGRVVVEQHVAAAIDLKVDEAGREPGAVRQACDGEVGGQIARGINADDALAVDHHGGVAMQRVAVEHVVRRDRVTFGRAHRVRVTFCRCRGWSASKPRSAREAHRRP